MTAVEKFVQDTEAMRLYQQERAILEITELIYKVMEQQGVNKTTLADRLGKSRGYVSQLLDGETNMTVRTISDVFTALGFEWRSSATPFVISQTTQVPTDCTESISPSWNTEAWDAKVLLHDEPAWQFIDNGTRLQTV